MICSKRQILDEFLGYVQEPGDARARTTAEALLADAIQRIWNKHTWRQFLMPTPFVLTTVANQRSYSLPENFGRISDKDGLIRNITRRSLIGPSDPADLQSANPTIGTSNETAGCPSRYYIDGSCGVNRQPSTSGEALEAVSDSSSDTSARVFIAGEDANGDWLEVQATLTGETAVALGAFRYVQQFSKGYANGLTPPTAGTSSVGTVRLRTVTDATVLQVLGPYETAREQQIITFVPVPDAAYEIAIPILRRPRRPVYDADPIPNGWAPAIKEDMTIYWRINQGKLSLNANVPRPDLKDLIENDNISRLPLGQTPYQG